MSQHFKFIPLRPYTRIKEGRLPKAAVVTFGKTPYEQKTYPVYPEIDDSPMKTYYNKYRYRVILNLWLAVLVFDWVGKDRKPPNAAS